RTLATGGLGGGGDAADIGDYRARWSRFFPRLVQRRGAPAALLSGGERKRGAVGRALMGRRRLLVLDDPYRALAPQVVAGIFRTVERLNRDEGLTILVAEQNVT
ncbi:ABC transporter ATP-binding protein, partial [Methylobacterium sp. E-045]|nr:ABC transporter ATP-binding protein [Methylobacterium sp. E-045]